MQSSLARVLVVDDNEDLRDLIVYKIKKKFNAQVDPVDSVAAAKEALGRERFNVVVFSHTDWAQGLELNNEYHQSQSQPFQYLLFVKDPDELPQCLKQRVSVIRKPDFEDLLSAIVWPPR